MKRKQKFLIRELSMSCECRDPYISIYVEYTEICFHKNIDIMFYKPKAGY